MNTTVNLNEKQISNDAEELFYKPYSVEVTLVGVAPILFHRWSCEDVEAKAAAVKNSKAKKTDNLEAYLYRMENGNIAIPTEYLRQSVIHVAKFRQDPRSPRKSAMDLFKASVIALSELADTGLKEPDYLDRRRVVIQRSAINRTRPALNAGWTASFLLLVQTPEYISADLLLAVITDAGRLVGIGDFRPSYGRFAVTKFEVLSDSGGEE